LGKPKSTRFPAPAACGLRAGFFLKVYMGRKAALYCRVSTADQSCERQEQDLLAYAARCGYEVAGVWKETIPGLKNHRTERKKVMDLAQARQIDVILVTELSRWGRSTIDLVHTLQDLQAYGVSLMAPNGMQFDLSTAQGKLFASVMAALAEFERDLMRERVRSGIAAAKARGKVFGRRKGHRFKADKFGPQVLEMVAAGRSYRKIAKELGLSKNTVMEIVKRDREKGGEPGG
jgi:DNA invertase Pin-like site-specific DNA recombinase